MNILVIHNLYQQPGGEDVVVDQETRLLQRNGHNVTVYRRSNEELSHLSLRERLGLIKRIVSASDSKLAIRRLIRELHPDLVHVHNTFLMVSPSVYEACHEEDVPVVQTLHNFRLLCPAATFFRDDGPCEDCVTHNLWHSVRHACYRDSRVISGAVAFMLQAHRSRQTWDRKIDSYIAISGFLREKFVKAGFPANKITVKPNFVDPDPGRRTHLGDHALFVGRLTPEKGLWTLVEAWERLPSAVRLVIVGDGPMRPQLQAEVARKGLTNIHFASRLRREETYDALKKAAFLIVPSTWYETFGLVVAEAFACGTPVLGSRIGALREMVEDQVTGLHFAPGDPDDVAKKVAWASEHAPEMAAMGKAARRAYEGRYTADANYPLLMNIYASAIDNHARFKRSWAASA
jgi:glycosyltransferase involved in cell wall biosynthesis